MLLVFQTLRCVKLIPVAYGTLYTKLQSELVYLQNGRMHATSLSKRFAKFIFSIRAMIFRLVLPFPFFRVRAQKLRQFTFFQFFSNVSKFTLSKNMYVAHL